MKLSADWIASPDVLERTVELPSFREAVTLVNRIADLAEAEDHHPDLAISYRRVTIRWTTHSAGGVTAKDEELALKTDELIDAAI